mgnify:CR=1 FL=1
MGIPTLISTSTASNASSVAITSGIDSTYDEYMFVFIDIGPATDNVIFQFNGSIDGGSNYNVTKTSTAFRSIHEESTSDPKIQYLTGGDLAQSTAYQFLGDDYGNGSDESAAGILHLFSPSSTTYVKHFYARMSTYQSANASQSFYIAGYFNDTNDIDAVSFKMNSGNFDGVIQLFGIA